MLFNAELYSSFRNKYLKSILTFTKNKSIIPEYKIYEILWALEHSLILWEDIPPGFDEEYKLPHVRDYGIDLINLDYNRTAQVKYYSEKSLN